MSLFNLKSKPLYHAKDRSATWVELFFDLIFVVVVSKITHILAHVHHGVHLEEGLWWKFPLMFLPIWWIWATHTFWSNLFDTDSKPHRAASLFVMLQMIVLSAIVGTDWDSSYRLFIGSYFGIRLTLAIFVIMHWKVHSEYASFMLQIGVVSLITSLISLCAIFFSPPLCYGVFYVGLGLDLIMPVVLGFRRKLPPIHREHLIERMGLLVIILMGESIISISAGLREVAWTIETILPAFFGAVMIGATWWIYFDSYHHLADEDGRLRTGVGFAYPHFLVCMGLSILANVIHHAIHSGLDRREYQIMAISGMAIFYIGKQIPYYVKFPIVRSNILINSFVTLGCCLASLYLPTNALILAGLTVSMLVYVVLNYFTTIQKIRGSEG